MRTTGFVAPLCVDGPIDGDVFPVRVRQRLVRELKPGDVAVTDDLSGHKVRGARGAIGAAGASAASPPPHGPGFDPIGSAFDKFKQALRSGAARTTEALWGLCAKACDLVTPADCRGFFRHCGYRHG